MIGMPHSIGVLFAFIALVSWGFGDFFIQKTARAIGSWKALFFIGVTGSIGLLPFVKNDLPFLSRADLLLLGVLGLIVLFTTIFDFEALRQGKIAVIEPIIGLELPLTVGLSVMLAQESLTSVQTLLIGVVFVGVMFAITTHHSRLHYHRRLLEKGALFAGVAAVGMALINVLVGVSSQIISPLMTIWFTHALLAVVCGGYFLITGKFTHLLADLHDHPGIVIGQSILDNTAWVAFAVSTTYIPIAIATTISESYIALAVLLGLFVNHEKLKAHQIAGVALATVGVIALSYF